MPIARRTCPRRADFDELGSTELAEVSRGVGMALRQRHRFNAGVVRVVAWESQMAGWNLRRAFFGGAFGQAPVFDTPEKLWRDFNPESPQLETRVLQTWREGNARFEKLRFTAERESGEKCGSLQSAGAAEGSRLPGILHIHGGGQTASLDWVRFWAKRGYVCVSYDFTGPWADRKEVTDWGPVKQGNAKQAQGSFLVLPTLRASSWFHWAVVARRALTLLSYHPKVDRSRLGIFGVSVGGTLCWIVAGTDERVRTSVPIYGCGFNYDKEKKAWGLPDLVPDLLLFNRALAPEAYASRIQRPLLLLDATNDFHGWMDDAYRILSEMRATNRVAFTPRYNHHIEAEQAANLPAWMDWQLKDGPPFPGEPKLSLRLSRDGDPVAGVHPADPRQVERVDVFYTLGDLPPPNRYWRKATTVRTKSAWEAALPVLKTSATLRTFANVIYQSGVCLSTDMSRTIPHHLGQARAALEWRASPDVTGDEPGAPFVFATANTDPNTAKTYFVRSSLPAERDAVCVNPAIFGDRIRFDILSHYLADEGYAGRDGMSLSFEYQGEFLAGSQITTGAEKTPPLPDEPGFLLHVSSGEFTPRFRTYRAFVETKGSAAGWQPVRLTLSQFRSQKGEPLPSCAAWTRSKSAALRQNRTRRSSPGFAGIRRKTSRSGRLFPPSPGNTGDTPCRAFYRATVRGRLYLRLFTVGITAPTDLRQAASSAESSWTFAGI